MTKRVHILSNINLDTNSATCKNCGKIKLYWRNKEGKRVPRCPIAVRSQRNVAKYAKGRHGLSDQERLDYLKNKICEICGDKAKGNFHIIFN